MTQVIPRTAIYSKLPDFPWDKLLPFKTKAAKVPEGLIDLTVGSPVDPVEPSIFNEANKYESFSGYPQVIGLPNLRSTIADSLKRRFGITDNEGNKLSDDNLVCVIGTKEYIAASVRDLGFQAGTLVGFPDLAYPTYEVAAILAGAKSVVLDTTDIKSFPKGLSVLFINSPSNPTGMILTLDQMRNIVEYAKENNTIVISDECYLGLNYGNEVYSILHPKVCGGDFTNLLAVHSLSKISNMASYRSGFVIGDPLLIKETIGLRKHSGMMIPTIIQAATIAACSDDEHIKKQAQIYFDRKQKITEILINLGFRIDHSTAGLYIWATRDKNCWEEVEFFASKGVMVTPGDFYGSAGQKHIRVSITVTDEAVDKFKSRFSN